MKQTLIAIVVVVAIITGAVLVGNDKDSSSVGTVSTNSYGKADSTVVLSEFGDFECPACANFYPLIKQIKEEYKDKIKFEFFHFPLVQNHANAIAAHRAAQAAANQGKFWEMHDLLYENQQLWSSQATTNPAPTFESYAKQLGLDMGKYTVDVAASATLGTINADLEKGKELNVSATPTFFLNGKKIEDMAKLSTIAEFRKFLDEALGIPEQETSAQPEAADGAETPADTNATGTPAQ